MYLLTILTLCTVFAHSVFALGETIVWEPKPTSSHNLGDQKWTVLKDGNGKTHLVLFETPEWTIPNIPNISNKKLIYLANKQKLTEVKTEEDKDKSDKNEDFDVHFFLYTRENNESAQEIIVGLVNGFDDTNFDLNKPVKIIIHGYLGSSNDESVQQIKNNLLDSEDSNVIIVDWYNLASDFFYPTSADNAKPVGQLLGDLLNFLIDQGVSPQNIHLIGHSLGAHVAGFASSSVSQRISRITGLDPALPSFVKSEPNQRLNADSAEFVDCIHTCGGVLGFKDPICSADFYPNGGTPVQPGCNWLEIGDCSHSRAHELFAESIILEHKFSSFSCPNIDFNSNVTCKNDGALMGYPASKDFKGIFYLKTNSQFPFSK